MDTRTTRLPVDLLDAAESEAASEHRSTAKQVEHWARIGMYLEGHSTAARRRVQRAIDGDVPLSDLSADEQLLANAGIDAAIAMAASEISFADRLAARGVTTVLLDGDGQIVQRQPDGTTTRL